VAFAEKSKAENVVIRPSITTIVKLIKDFHLSIRIVLQKNYQNARYSAQTKTSQK